MTPEQTAIYAQCTGRSTPPTTPFSEAALIVGRRGGKSRVLALIAVCLACLRDYEPYLAAGEVATVVVLAANRSQARAIFRYVHGLIHAIEPLAAMVVDENSEAIVLNNRVVIEISTASFRTTRGYTFAAVLCDEIAFWRQDETSANPDVEILRALRPGMASIPGSVLLLASSPYAKRGELYQTFRKNYGRDDARVLVWKADTATMNPRIDPAIIAEAYESDPEAARAEYGGEFRDDLADFITRETVDAITAWGRRDLPPEPGVTYAAFCDPSGGASDAMTLAVAHLRDDVCVLDAVIEIRPPFDPDAAVVECVALLRRFGVARVTGDRYAGLWPVARFAAHGIEFEQSARPKSDLYRDFLPLANAKRVELLEHPRLSAQLVGLERRTARGGRDSIDHTPGGHDDLANCVAGVLVGLDLDRRPQMVRPNDMLAQGAALPLPQRCDAVFGVLAQDKRGGVAVVYCATSRGYGVPLLIVDFEAEPGGSGMLPAVRTRLFELAEACGARMSAPGLLVPELLLRQAERLDGLRVAGVPAEIDPAERLLSAATHIGSGAVKIAALAHDKARVSPLGPALDFRAGEAADTALRAAAVLAVVCGLEGE